MIRPMRMGLLLIALGGSFWIGKCQGVGEADQLREINAYNRMAFFGWTNHARIAYEHRIAAESKLHDCNDALVAFVWKDEYPMAGTSPHVWFSNPEGKPVKYTLPPLRPRTWDYNNPPRP